MSDTGLYDPRVEALLGRSILRHRGSAEALGISDGTPLPLQLLDASVTMDEDRSPRVTADLVCSMPERSLWEQLDPRARTRVAVFGGYTGPGWASSALLLDGVVVDRDGDRPAGTMSLTVEGTERVVIDNAASTANNAAGGSRTGTARRVVDTAFSPAPTWIDTTTDAATVAAPDLVNNDRWDVVRDLCDQAGADAYDRGDRVWVMEYRPTAAGEVRLALASGPGGNVLTARPRTSRTDGFANRVQLVYEWQSGTTSGRIVSTRDVTAGPLRVQPGNTVSHREVRRLATTQAQADNAAFFLARRLSSRGQAWTITAEAALWLRPGHTVTLTLPNGGTSDLIVSRLRFQLGVGLMDLDLRLPDLTATTIGAPA